MGIYIRGTKMPKDEKAIHLEIHSDGTVLMWQMGDDDKVVGTAIEVPPHGRLGDLDALIANHFSDEHRIAMSYADKCWMRRIINGEQTIIPADPD